MPRLYLVRHAKITRSEDPDPGLGEVGRTQAEALATALAPKGPLPILTSPFRRARETAAPLARLWGVTSQTDTRLGELPLPPDSKFRSHSEWLKYALTRRWPEMHESLRSWRDQVLQALLEIPADAVVVLHFVGINVAVGHALRDDRVNCFQPENCSCTVLDSAGKDLRLIELGAEGEPRVK
jgi:broad specificity phosphatase PhoE